MPLASSLTKAVSPGSALTAKRTTLSSPTDSTGADFESCAAESLDPETIATTSFTTGTFWQPLRAIVTITIPDKVRRLSTYITKPMGRRLTGRADTYIYESSADKGYDRNLIRHRNKIHYHGVLWERPHRLARIDPNENLGPKAGNS